LLLMLLLMPLTLLLPPERTAAGSLQRNAQDQVKLGGDIIMVMHCCCGTGTKTFDACA
jgi:hypothetical protein